MANKCWNLFSFYGNEKVVNQVKQWQEKLNSALPTEDDEHCMDAIRTVFYPDTKTNDEIDYGCEWVHHDNKAFSPDVHQLGFQSAWESPDGLQEHLTLLLSKLDKDVLVENNYNSEDGSMGFVYSAVNSQGDVCIETAHADLDLDDFDNREDADEDQQKCLDEYQIDALIDLVYEVPNTEKTVKKYLPYLEINWDLIK